MITKSRALSLPIILVALGTCATLHAQNRFDDLTKRIPAGANALMAIDVQAVESSPLAVKEGWKQIHSTAYAQRPIILPPEAELVVIASQLDTNADLVQMWQLALMELKERIPLTAIAKSEGGQLDVIEGLNIVWSPSQVYFIEFGEKLLALLSPDDRQFMARWALDQKAGRSAELSPYLKAAMAAVTAPKPIVLAIDTNYAVQPHRLKSNLANSTVLREKKIKGETLVPLLLGLRGLTLEIGLKDTAEGTLRIDFSGDVAPLRDIAKPLVLETLDRFDAHLPGLDKWTVHTQGNQISMTGSLDHIALRRIFSLLEIPTTKFSTINPDDVGKTPSADQAAQRSKEYYTSVTTLLDDVRATLDKSRDFHAMWQERYAKKIDQLPILYVDQALLDWGAMVGETLRSIALTKRQTGLQQGVQKSAIYGNYYNYSSGYGYGGYGGGYVGGSVVGDQLASDQISMQQLAVYQNARFESWKQLDDSTAKIRKDMTKKYGMEF